MRLICPSCGAIASAEAWQNETTVRQFLGVLEKLPGVVRDRALPYLGLFRSGRKTGLSWPRALRVLSGLVDLVEPGTVHWDGGETRPCPPAVWAAALDALLARRPTDLENHNYLRRVAWDKAEQLASLEERSKEYASSHRQHADPGPETVNDAPMTPEQYREWMEQLGKTMSRMGSGSPGGKKST